MTDNTLRQRFEAPERSFFPTPFWWWSGDPVEPERLRWQMERLNEGGVHNLMIMNLAPRAPLFAADEDDPAFMSERWWELLEGVCRDADELGMTLWMYDQIGFSSANLQGDVLQADPAAAGQALKRLVAEADAGELVRLACPPSATPLAAAAVDPSGTLVEVPVADGAAEWSGPGRLMLFYAAESGFDYLSKDACAKLLDLAQGEYERRLGQWLGKVIVGGFQDELPSTPIWSAGFRDEFERRMGYDLVPRLAELWEDLGPDSAAIRRDYHRVRAEVTEEAFFEPLCDWYDRHGMLCSFDQMSRNGEPVGSSQFYADYALTHRHFSVPGSDQMGDSKIHSSFAHAYGHERTWLECFHSSGWGGTLEETYDWILPWIGAGATLYNPHATYYSTRKGWWEWAPPSTDWRQPYWRHHLHFARAIARLCSVLSWGTHACDVAVLFPTATAQSGLKQDGPDATALAASDVHQRIVGRMLWWSSFPGVLNRIARDYDILDEEVVAASEVVDGALAHHGERYAAVVLPACTVVTSETAARLTEFVDGGGRLIAVGALPERAAGLGADPAPVAALRERFERGEALLVAEPEDLAEVLAEVPAVVQSDVPTLRRQAGDQTVVFVPAAFIKASEVRPIEVKVPTDPAGYWDTIAEFWEMAKVTIDFDRSRYAPEREVTVAGVEGAPELWEPFSGRRRRLDAEPVEGGVRVRVPFTDGPAALLVWGAGETDALSPPLDAEPDVDVPILLDGPWESTIEQTMDDTWEDLDAPDPELPIEAWSLESLEGDKWVPAHATFGARALWSGPAAPEGLPAPGATLADGREAVWSPSRGIHKDPVHQKLFGPHGYVPEEFLAFGTVAAGEGVHMRTVLHVPKALETNLAVAAAAAKAAWLDGEPVALAGAGYLVHGPVSLPAGAVELDLRFEVGASTDLRAQFAFVADLESYLRPEWLRLVGDPVEDSVASFSRRVELGSDAVEARARIGTSAACRLFVDGRELGRFGGFTGGDDGPLAAWDFLGTVDLTAELTAGEHEIEIEVRDPGHSAPAIMFDAEILTSTGERVMLRSDVEWSATRDGEKAAIEPRLDQFGTPLQSDPPRTQFGDPAYSHLTRRPHPLPRADWLEPGREVVDAGGPVEPRVGAEVVSQRLRTTAPPGAELAVVALAPGCRLAELLLDGEPIELPQGAGGEESRVPLPSGGAGPRQVELLVDPAPGLRGGAVLAGPLRFAVGNGLLELGDWMELGLTAHSGGVRYSRILDDVPSGPAVLDLGDVRGTAEVLVDGESIGVRICAPYLFELDASPGAQLEVVVLNTLAPHLDAISPTHFVFDGQARSGLFGPVRIWPRSR